MSANYSIGQNAAETSVQSLDLFAPRNPAEELIFQRTDAVKMIETSDGSIHYLDETGQPVAVMNVDGSVYLWADGSWQRNTVDDVIAKLSQGEVEQSVQPDVSEDVALANEVEPEALVCQSTSENFTEDSLMSIADEDRYCDEVSMQCRMPDEDRATERHAKRFAESAPTGGSSNSGGSEPSAKKKVDKKTETETIAVDDVKDKGSEGVETIDYADSDSSGAISDDVEDDTDGVGGLAAEVAEEPMDAPEVSQPVGNSSHDVITMPGGENSPVDLSAAIFNSNKEMPLSNVSTTIVGSTALTNDLVSGVPVFMESGAKVMFENYFTDFALDDFIGSPNALGVALLNNDSSMLNQGAGGSIVEHGAFVMLDEKGAGSQFGVASKTASTSSKSHGVVKGRRRTSLKVKSQVVPNADSLTDAQSVAGHGGTPHMSSIPGVVGMAEMGDLNKNKLEVRATIASGDKYRDERDGQQKKEGNSEEWAEAFEDEEDLDFIA